MKIVYNGCYGEFDLSQAAFDLYNRKRIELGLSGVTYYYEIDRDDILLVEVVEELGSQASAKDTLLLIADINDEYTKCYTIDDNNGKETILCQPLCLVEHYLKGMPVNKLTDMECRLFLEKMVNILN